MEFLIDFCPYVIAALVLFVLGFNLSRRENRLRESTHEAVSLPWYSWEAIASILLIALFSALRYYTGNDYRMYLTNFQQLQADGSCGAWPQRARGSLPRLPPRAASSCFLPARAPRSSSRLATRTVSSPASGR